MAGGFSDILAGLAPAAGNFLGNLFGGQKGAQIGQGIGGLVSNIFGGGAPQPQPQAAPSALPPPPPVMTQGESGMPPSLPTGPGPAIFNPGNFGGTIGGAIDQYLPKQYQGMGRTIGSGLGNFGSSLMGSLANHPTLGKYVGMANQYLPQAMQYAPQALGGLSSFLGGMSHPFLKGLGGFAGQLGNMFQQPQSFAHGGYASGGPYMPHYGIGGSVLGSQLLGPVGAGLGMLLPFSHGGHVPPTNNQIVPGHGGMSHWPWPHQMHHLAHANSHLHARGGAIPMAHGGQVPATNDQIVPGHGGMTHWPYPPEMSHPLGSGVTHLHAEGGPVGHYAMGGPESEFTPGNEVRNISDLMGMVQELAPFVAQEVASVLPHKRRQSRVMH